MRIKEVIVVEGKHDTATLKQYFDVDTIETNGSAIHKDILNYIAEVNERRGVIVFTDPDFSGERIRKIINQAIPNVKNAFIEKKKALGNHKVGVEHATYEDLKASLDNCVCFNESADQTISAVELRMLNLDGCEQAKKNRETIGWLLHFGPCNAKTFLKRVNLLGISIEELVKLCKERGIYE